MPPPLHRVGVILVLVVAACSNSSSQSTDPTGPEPAQPTTTTATVEVATPWAYEAEQFFVSLANAEDRAAARFFGELATFTVSYTGLHLEGRADIENWFTIRDGPRLPASGPLQLYLSSQGAVVLAPEMRVSSYRPGWDHLTSILVMQIDDGLIQSYDGEWLSSWLQTAGGMRWDDAGRLEALYEEYVTAWNSGEEDRIQSVYRPGASRLDGLFGGSMVFGEDWAAGIALHLQPRAAGVSYEPVGQSFEPHDEVVNPAIFGPTLLTEPTHAHAIFDIRTAEGCPLRLLANWELSAFRIAHEEISYEVGSLRRCGSVFGIEAPPEGWWSDVSVPAPFLEEVTAIVPSPAGREIPVLNGNQRQVELVEWALGRFAASGLSEPAVDLVGFPPNVECGAVTAAGLARFDHRAAHVYMCLEPGDICNGPTCDRFQLRARAALLHELGHIWEFQNVDQATRDAFMDLRGLDMWSDAESGWAAGGAEGIEHAAEILSWGLMDEPMELIRIPDTGEAELTAAFQLLTGRAPLHS